MDSLMMYTMMLVVILLSLLISFLPLLEMAFVVWIGPVLGIMEGLL